MDESLTRQAEAREIAFQALPENVRFYLECELETYKAQGFEPVTYDKLLSCTELTTDVAVLVISLAKAPYRELRSPLGYYVDTYRCLQANHMNPFTELGQATSLILDNGSGTRTPIPYNHYVDWEPMPVNRIRHSEIRTAQSPAEEAFEYNSGVSSEGHVDYHAFTDLVWFLKRRK